MPPGFKFCSPGSPPKCIGKERISIRVQLPGFRARLNETRLTLYGKKLECNLHHVTVGMEKSSVGCTVDYDLCATEGMNEDGDCQVLCRMKTGQVGKQIKLTIMVSGEDDDTQLCAIGTESFPTYGSPGRSEISSWQSFLQDIEDVF